MRSGNTTLALLAVPLNVHIMRALDEDPVPLPDLRRAVGHPPVTTMRAYLRTLTQLGVVERHREEGFPGSISYSATKPGKKLLAVADVLQNWLEAAPEGPVELGGIASKSAIKALLDGWEAGLVRALAARPLALTELDRLIPPVSYPALERRLTAMRQVGLLEPCPERDGRVTRYDVTQWLRCAVAPLSAAMGWEYECLLDRAPPPGPLDVEAVFLLKVPSLDFSSEASGTCRMAVEFRRGSAHEFAGVMLDVSEGRVNSCVTRLEGRSDAWVSGSTLGWLRWLNEGDDREVEIGGDAALAHSLDGQLRSKLLAVTDR